MRVALALVGIAVALASAACAPGRVKQYQDLLDPLVGTGTRTEIDAILGKPRECTEHKGLYRCEYRTTGAGEAMNKQSTTAKSFTPFAGREIAEQQNSDVLNLFYDYRGRLKEWQPTAIMP